MRRSHSNGQCGGRVRNVNRATAQRGTEEGRLAQRAVAATRRQRARATNTARAQMHVKTLTEGVHEISHALRSNLRLVSPTTVFLLVE